MNQMIKRAAAAILSVCVAVTAGPGLITAHAKGSGEEQRVITAFTELPQAVRRQTVEVGTEMEDLRLPQTLEVTYTVYQEEEVSESESDDPGYTVATGSQAAGKKEDSLTASPSQIKPGGGYIEAHKKIKVTWESFPDYAGEEGEYIFTPVLPEMYTEGDGVSLPEIEVAVEVEETLSDAVGALMKKIDALPSVDSIYKNIPGNADPEFDQWLSGMREVMKAVRDARRAYDALTEEEKRQLPLAYTEKLMDLVGLMERLNEMLELSGGNNWSDYAAGSFDGGDGSASRPYEIRTPEQLAYLAKKTEAETKNKYYKLTADVDLGAHYWIPSASAFCGNFDGNGRTISNMLCRESAAGGKGGGLFGEINGTDAAGGNLKIHDVILESCSVQDNPAQSFEISGGAGILAGYVWPGVDFVNCHVRDSEVRIFGDTYNVGGLVGYVGYYSKPSSDTPRGQKITDCSVSDTAVANQNGRIGGMVGHAYCGMERIENCVAENVMVQTNGGQSNGAQAGGLVGTLKTGILECEISDCRVIKSGAGTSTVDALDESLGIRVGGLIGEIIFEKRKKPTKLIRCTSEAAVTSEAAGNNGGIGGLVGIANNSRSWAGTVFFSIEDCHASGHVTSKTESVGGLVGSMMGNLKNCTASGNVTGYWQVGGLVGGLEGSGDNPPASISGCSASGSVTGEQGNKSTASNAVGGLIGYAGEAHIESSCALGDVTGDGFDYGGLVGNSYKSKIINCYSTGDVSSEQPGDAPRAGGLIGNGNSSEVRNCYSSGRVTTVEENAPTAAAFIGYSMNRNMNSSMKITVENCSYDKETSGQAKGVGTADASSVISLKAEKTADMKHPNQAYYLNENGQNSVWGWKKGENSDYPYLGEPKITTEQNGEAYLTSLAVFGKGQEAVTLTPAFDRDTLAYRLQTSESGIEIRAEASAGATMRLRGNTGEREFTGVSVEPLAVGENLIYIDVVSEDGMEERSYAIAVLKEESGALTGALKGIVTEGGAPVAGAEVEVRIGGTDGDLAAGTFTAQNGSFVFYGLEYGVYSVVVTQAGAGRRITRMAEITAEETSLVIDLPEGNKSTAVEREGADTPPIAAEGLEELFDDRRIAAEDEKGYTEEDKATVENGGSAEIKLNGERKQESELGTDIDRLQAAADGETPVLILDFTVIKTVKDSAGNKTKEVRLTELPALIHIVIPIPEELKGKEIRVIRLHDGRAEELPEGSGPEYFVRKEDYIHLYVRKFSLYGFTGSEGKAEDPAGSGQGSRGGSQDEPAGTWKRDEIGWYYQYDTKLRASDGWYYLYWDGRHFWYHFDVRGYLDTGWLTDKDGNQYYLHPYPDGNQGYMYTGWRRIHEKWYYFEPTAGRGQGRLYRSTVTPDGYAVDERGEWIS